MEKPTLDVAIKTTQNSIDHLKRISEGYKMLGRPGKYEDFQRAEEGLEVVLAVLKGYKDDIERKKPTDPARAALAEACSAAAVNLNKINTGLSGAYETLPRRLAVK